MEHDLLQQLLDETANATTTKLNFDKIKSLMHKSSKMRQEERQRADNVEQYFVTLKKRIDESSSYLEKAKKDLENINFTFERERIHNGGPDYEDFMNKSDEEIDREMNSIKSKLAALESRVRNLNENTYGAEENFMKSIKTLENISKGVYSGDDMNDS